MKHLSRTERRRRAREGTPVPATTSPAPPRPVPARPPGATGHRRLKPVRWVWWGVGVAVLLVIVGGVWWALSSRPAAGEGPKIDGERVPYEGNTHVEIGTSIDYRAHPPASGSHYPTPIRAGVYPEGIPPGFWVHNLEHGYIVLAYRPPASPAQIRQFEQLLQSFPKSKYTFVKLVVVPYQEMDHPYAVLAWTWRLWLDQFDRAKVLGFYRAHVDRGPEDVP